MIEKDKYYVFYDGDCGFCNFWVYWILKNDKKDQFLFASLQSNFGQKFLKDRGLETKTFNTLYLWKPERFYFQKSNAVLKISEIIGGIYSLLVISKIFPRILRDWLYDIFAKNRNKLLKKCFIVDNEEIKKFIL